METTGVKKDFSSMAKEEITETTMGIEDAVNGCNINAIITGLSGALSGWNSRF
jgi:hypothetical protein